MLIPSKLYDILKWVCLVVLPSVSTCVSVILSLWNLADANTIAAIVGTISAVDALIGALLGVSTAQYNKTDKE